MNPSSTSNPSPQRCRRIAAFGPTVIRHLASNQWSPSQLNPFLHCYRPARKHPAATQSPTGNTMNFFTAALGTGFIFIFLLGAESSLMKTPSLSSALSFHARTQDLIPRREHRLSPIERQLHNFHAVPLRYVYALPPHQQFALLSLLSRPVLSCSLAAPSRRAVFTHIHSCNTQQCLRALASAIAYSQMTTRIPVIFIDVASPQPLIDTIQHNNGGTLSKDAIVCIINEGTSNILFRNTQTAADWAEISVIEAVIPSQFVFNSSQRFGSSDRVLSPLSRDPSYTLNTEEYAERLSVTGNTKRSSTLDGLAVVDTHVSLSLSEVVWSRYAPRTAQEDILSSLLQNSPRNHEHVVSRASILGRRDETKTAEKADYVLHHTFQLPDMLLRGLTPLARKLLLLKLMSKKRKGVKNPRTLFVHTQYGLGNRLRALGSAMAFARRTDRVLVLVWVPDQHLNCKYSDLFVPNDEFVVSDEFSAGEYWPFRNNAARDAAMKSVKWYSFMRINGVQANLPSEEVTDDKLFHIYVSTCYVIQSPQTPFIIRTQSSFWKVLRTLTPHIKVARLVDRFSAYPMSNMIGVHIRGKSIKSDIQGISAEDYSPESSKRTDYWRSLTRVDAFIDEMKRQTADQLFYVAADQKEVLDRLEREFPSRVFFTPRRCDNRDKDCLPFALADILLLAKCASLRGSYWSSFSELSVRIGGARFLLAGIDFGRP